MHHLPPIPVAACALIALASVLRPILRLLAGGPPAPVAKPFLTARETAMLAAIERVLPAHRIHAQVAMGALLQVPARLGRRITHADRNSFSQKIVDFVVQDRADGGIVALVEVDDRSHDAHRDQARDAMTARAGYRTIRIAASAKPTLADVRRALAPILQAGSPQPVPSRRCDAPDRLVAPADRMAEGSAQRSGGGHGSR